MKGGSIKRRLLRRTPFLSKFARHVDALEEENRALQDRLAPTLLSTEAESRETEAVDDRGLPIPPARLRYWVAANEDAAWFLETGRLGAETLRSLFARHQIDIDRMESILDFGCGCGRVMRHLRDFENVRLHGTDSNAAAIAWCDQHFNFAEFSTNRLEPPTRYRPHSFDAIYAFSVFTHLPEALQLAWMHELRRIVKPGGYVVVTLHGDYYLPHISEAARVKYLRGEPVVLGEEVVGQNRCSAFHPESYVRNVLARGFEIVDFIPQGALGNPKQDLYLLKS
jgi:SAM-dependent methyltransferase